MRGGGRQGRWPCLAVCSWAAMPRADGGASTLRRPLRAMGPPAPPAPCAPAVGAGGRRRQQRVPRSWSGGWHERWCTQPRPGGWGAAPGCQGRQVQTPEQARRVCARTFPSPVTPQRCWRRCLRAAADPAAAGRGARMGQPSYPPPPPVVEAWDEVGDGTSSQQHRGDSKIRPCARPSAHLASQHAGQAPRRLFHPPQHHVLSHVQLLQQQQQHKASCSATPKEQAHVRSSLQAARAQCAPAPQGSARRAPMPPPLHGPWPAAS